MCKNDGQSYRVFITYCVFSKILKYIFRTLASLGFPSLAVCVYTMAELAEFRKITTLRGKTQYLINTLYANKCEAIKILKIYGCV